MTLEGFNNEGPYLDSAGILTDCYGETQGVKPGVVRSLAACKGLLDTRTYEFASHVLDNLDRPVSPMTLAAYTSFAYNVGKAAFSTSTLRRLHNDGQYAAACEQMRRWNKITVMGVKVTSNGLTNRRDKEVALCLGGVA